MTSMLLTDRYAAAASVPAAGGGGGHGGHGSSRMSARANGPAEPCASPPVDAGTATSIAARTRGSGDACAAQRDATSSISLLQSRGVMFFSLAYAAADSSIIPRTSCLSGWIQSVITFHLLAVPLLELDRAAALVVGAGHLERLHEAGGAELLQPRLGDVEVLDAPADLLGRQRLLAVLLLRLADRLDGDDAVHDAAVVVDRADARLVLHLALALRVDVLLDLLDHREVGAGDVEAGRDVALGRVARGNRVLFRARTTRRR